MGAVNWRCDWVCKCWWAAQPCPVVMGCSLAGKGQGEWRTNSRAAGKMKSTPAVIFQQKTTKQSPLVWRMIPRPEIRFYRRSWCKKRRWPLSTQLDDSLQQMLCPQNERPVFFSRISCICASSPGARPKWFVSPRVTSHSPLNPPLPINIFLPVPESTSTVFIALICLFVPSYKRLFFSHFPICHLHIPPAFLCLGHNSLQGQQSYFETSITMSLCLFCCFVILTEYNKQKVL